MQTGTVIYSFVIWSNYFLLELELLRLWNSECIVIRPTLVGFAVTFSVPGELYLLPFTIDASISKDIVFRILVAQMYVISVYQT